MKDYLSRVLKKTLAVALSAAMLCSTAAFAEAVGFAGSSISGIVASAASSETIPEGYTAIYTIDDLYNIRSNTSGNYILMNDIDLSATAPGGDWDCGTGWAVIESFSGTLDGQGHKIKNMHLYGNIQQAGFIAENNGIIKNIRFDDVVVNVGNTKQYGTICAYLIPKDTNSVTGIECCSVSGKIDVSTIAASSGYVGGLVGYGEITIDKADLCYLKESYNSADIIINNAKSSDYLGGLIGFCKGYKYRRMSGNYYTDANTYTSIYNSYNSGSITGECSKGGLVGSGTYYYDFLNGRHYCCNFSDSGLYPNGINSDDCYYLAESNSGIAARTAEQFQSPSNCPKLDFTENGPWEMAPDGSRPQLKNIREITVTDIEITRMPPKTTYTVGETLIAVGEISVVCSNGNTGTAAITTDMLSGYDMNKVGKQNVTISYMGATADYKITVNPIKATNISLSENQVSINKAQPTKVLTATVLPENTTDKTVTWKSCNPTVATVSSNGTITAVNPGITTITASTENGLTAVCNITVYEIRKSEKIPETCTSDGVKEYYYTFVNAPVKYYEDSACRTEINNIETWKVIPAAGHSILITQENRKEATCTEPGNYEEVKTCSACGEEVSRTTRTIRATGHTAGPATQENRHEATCTQPGSFDEVKYCTVCGAEISRETKTIPATGHTPGQTVQENRREATCTTPGSYDEVTYCTTCDEELNRVTKSIPATGHTPGQNVTENRREATCTQPGNYEEVKYCSVCGTEISRNTKTIPATGHTPGQTVTENRIEATCTQPGSYDEVKYCTVCGAEISRETKTIPATGHTPGQTVQENRIEATCTQPGSYDEVVRCTVCREELSRDRKTIPATGHKWSEWKTNGNKLVRTCKNDSHHTETKDIVVKSIKLNKTKLTLKKGKSQTLKATVSPSNATNKKLTWSTSDKKIATVSNGKVTAKKSGTVTITVKSSDGKKAICKVTVNVPSTKIKLNKTKLTLIKGDTSKLKATVTPSDSTDKITWSSSNRSVVTVSGGKLTAKRKGSATITVKTSSGKKATCKVTVKEVHVKKITLNKSSLTLKAGNTSTLKATVSPSKNNDTIKWTSSDPSVVSVSNGKLTAKKKGTATITVKSSNGKKATCKVTVKSVPLSKAQTGFKKVAKYIETYGKTNSNGEKFIKETVYLDSVGDVDIGIVYNDYNSSLTIIMNNSQYKYPFTGNATLSIVQYYSSINESDANIVYYAEHYLYSSNDFGFNTKSTFSPSTASNKSYYSIDYVDSYGLGSDSAESTYNLSNTLIQFTLTAADLLLRDNGMSLNDLGYSNF